MGNKLSSPKQQKKTKDDVHENVISNGRGVFDDATSSKKNNSKQHNKQMCIAEEKNTYRDRIDGLLKVVDEYTKHKNDNNKQGQDIYDLVCNFYRNNDGIHGFMKDYGKYVENADNIYKENINLCDFASCSYVEREYRDRTTYDVDHSQRFKLYKQCKSEDAIVIKQLLDQLHVVKYHLTDLGLRYIPNNVDEDQMDDDNNDHWLFNQMKNDLAKMRKSFPRNQNLNAKNTSKFVTQILKEENKNDADDDIKRYSPYSFGIRFYYHPYYKNNMNNRELLPGTEILETGNYLINPSYSYASWYITPKAKSIKDEVLNGKNVRLCMIEYNNILLKATFKYKALSNAIKGADGMWEGVYGIKKNAKITLHHIFSLLLYTNATDLQNEFSKSFRKLNLTETDESLKERHSEYAYWAKALREVVECWGSATIGTRNETKSKRFYHGISQRMVFDRFDQRFCGPTSTSLNLTVALNFACDGVVLTIENQSTSTFFNCIRWSDFSFEQEMLYLAGFAKLKICGLTDAGYEINYDREIRAMNIFQSGLMDSTVSTEMVQTDDVDLINILVNDVMNEQTNEKSTISAYVHGLFINLLRKAKRISIDISLFDYDMLYEGRYGYKALKHLYFDEKNRLKLNMLSRLFPSLQTLSIRKRRNMFSSSSAAGSSLIVDDALMLDILLYLSNEDNKCKEIVIKYPSNHLDSLNGIISKYSTEFSKIKFQFLIQNSVHPQYGLCSTFYIVFSN